MSFVQIFTVFLLVCFILFAECNKPVSNNNLLFIHCTITDAYAISWFIVHLC